MTDAHPGDITISLESPAAASAAGVGAPSEATGAGAGAGSSTTGPSIPTQHTLKFFFGTWNVGNAQPPDDLSPWVAAGGGGYDVLVFGVQEAVYKQKHAYPYIPVPRVGTAEEGKEEEEDATSADGGGGAGAGAASASATPAVGSGATPAAAPSKKSLEVFNVIARHVGEGYYRVCSQALWEMGTLVLACNSLADVIPQSAIEVKCEATGFGGITPNKGGVVIVMTIYQTKFCFVSSHLAAHLKHLEARNSNFSEIIDQTRLGAHKDVDLDAQFDHCFWVGDLNYRVDLRLHGGIDSLSADQIKAALAAAQVPCDLACTSIVPLVAAGAHDQLISLDQLKACQKAGLAFVGFTEGTYKFSPTFKVKRGTTHYEHSTEREPSYCDRVLWKSLPGLRDDVIWHSNSGHPGVITSDHKPVSAVIDVVCRPQRPLSHDRLALVLLDVSCEGMFAADIGGTSDPYFLVKSHPEHLLVPGEGKAAVPKSSTKSRTLTPRWESAELPPLTLAAKSVEDLDGTHLYFVFMDYDMGNADDRIGQAVLHLGSLTPSVTSFTLPITRNGKAAGTMTGRVSIVNKKVADMMKSNPKAAKKCCVVM